MNKTLTIKPDSELVSEFETMSKHILELSNIINTESEIPIDDYVKWYKSSIQLTFKLTDLINRVDRHVIKTN
jgi:hypothetical protein